MIRILLVDDHALFREGIASLLGGQPDLTVVGEAGSVRQAIAMTLDLKPDLVLMDFTLPDGTGLDATQAILARRPETQIVFLTVHEEDDRLFEAIRSGAQGYLLKNVPVKKLLRFLRGLEQGEAAISPVMTSRILQEFSRLEPSRRLSSTDFSDLTAREMDVLRELTTGATNQEIAERLFIAENTVKNHLSSVFAKLEVQNRRQAARYARTHGVAKN